MIVVLFGNRVFADVLKLRDVIQVGSKPTRLVTFLQEGRCCRHAQRADGYLMVEAGSGVVRLHTRASLVAQRV